MKRILSLTLILCFILGIFSVISVSADDNHIIINDEFIYDINEDGTLTLASCRSDKEKIIVESNINGYKVKDILSNAFNRNTDIRFIEIEDGIESIGRTAFTGCVNLETITIPDSVTSIGIGTFKECINLKSVRMSENIKHIGEYAFASCDSLETITIPDTLETCGKGAFSKSGLKSVTIEEGITEIYDTMFLECRNLESIKIPSTVTKLGNECFSYCTSLKSIEIPASVKEAKNAFFKSGIKEVTLVDGCTEICDYMFYRAESLETLNIPNTVKRVGTESLAYTAVSDLSFV